MVDVNLPLETEQIDADATKVTADWAVNSAANPTERRQSGEAGKIYVTQRFQRVFADGPVAFHELLRRWKDGGVKLRLTEELLRWRREHREDEVRAGASIDLEHDKADLERKIACPVLALWGAKAPMGRTSSCAVI